VAAALIGTPAALLLAPLHQHYLLQARQMQALSFAAYDTLVLVVVAVLGGGAILFPSLVLLFRLLIRGQFDPGAGHKVVLAPSAGGLAGASASGLVARSAGACLMCGFGLLTIADAPWTHTIGVLCLLAFVVLAFAAIGPTALAASGEDEPA
jgi:cytochrome d ubiquinol oxidase subunit II